MKILYFFVALFAFIVNSNAAIFQSPTEDKELMSMVEKPLFYSEHNVREKKLFNTSLGFIYQLNNFNISTTGASVNGNSMNGSFNNASNFGLIGHMTLNLTSKAWLRLNAEGSWMSGVGNGVASTYNSNDGATYEIKAVFGYDVLSYKSFDVSAYAGLYHRGINYNSSITAGGNNVGFTTNYTGAVYGLGLTHYAKNMITHFFAEGYLVGLYGSMDTMAGNASYFLSQNYGSTSPAAGFGIGASTDIEMFKNVYIKPFTKFQMMFSSNMNFAGANVGGMNNFQIATFGLALAWR